jgi:hypothetical protein
MSSKILSNYGNVNHSANSGPDSSPAESGGAVFKFNDALGKNGQDIQYGQADEARFHKSECA